MKPKVDLTGRTYNYLYVIGPSKKRTKYLVHYWCQCTRCGNLKCVREDHIKYNRTKSCGCIRVSPNKTHGKTKTKSYSVWEGIKTRCYNKNSKSYKNYGGRGIKVCDRWLNSFENFYTDMGDVPKNMTIERVNNDGDYCPENCTWVSIQDQQRNRRAKGYRWKKESKKWVAKITRYGVQYHLGYFDTEKEALEAYKRAKRTFKKE